MASNPDGARGVPLGTPLENALAEMVRSRRGKETKPALARRAGCELGTVVAVENAAAEQKPLGEVKRLLLALGLRVTFGGNMYRVWVHAPQKKATRRQAKG